MHFTFGLRRRFVQIITACITNWELTNFLTGKIYKGPGKNLCAPGLNCYSCPSAALSCPIGALQTVGGTTGFGISFYVSGFLLLLGLLMGRFVCGFLCPFGFFQELLHKLPVPKKKLFPPLIYVKYAVLVIFVLLVPLGGAIYGSKGLPAFCEYICPAGTLEGAIPLLITHPEFRQAAGILFAWKFFILIGVVVGCMFIYRFFCKTLCPLGAIYGLLNPVSLYRLRLAEQRCIACGKCQEICPMNINPARQTASAECIMCGKCIEACPHQALYLGREQKFSGTQL